MLTWQSSPRWGWRISQNKRFNETAAEARENQSIIQNTEYVIASCPERTIWAYTPDVHICSVNDPKQKQPNCEDSEVGKHASHPQHLHCTPKMARSMPFLTPNPSWAPLLLLDFSGGSSMDVLWTKGISLMGDDGCPAISSELLGSTRLFKVASRLIKDWKEMLWDSSNSHLLASHPASENQQPFPWVLSACGKSPLVG